ncbi:HAD-IIB family hydrolase [Bacillus toyonensis]|uniref:HAD-IIB family hydrolase n=1 Tax=Bacillus toyonensis TaxID=155322 RepID=UPI000BED4149|nr:HAD-IIB family hydrolase [Bacillus toyonensis]PEC08081.1 hypothetical protein CON55_26045 [Bacillus toyonensis]
MNLHKSLKKQKIKFAAFDLDGTLLDANGKLFVNTIQGLIAMRNQDIKMFIVTGRTIDSFLSLSLPIEFLELFNENIICNDGIILYNTKTKLVKSHSSISSDVFLKTIENLTNKNEIVIEIDGKHFSPEKAPALKYSMLFKINRGAITIKEQKINSTKNLTKIVMFPQQNEVKKIVDSLKNTECNVKELKFLHAIEITPKETCKATGLLNFLSERHNINNLNSVIAFGDGINDCTLLKKSKIGVAVNNSHPKAIENSNVQLNQSLGEYLVQNLS